MQGLYFPSSGERRPALSLCLIPLLLAWVAGQIVTGWGWTSPSFCSLELGGAVAYRGGRGLPVFIWVLLSPQRGHFCGSEANKTFLTIEAGKLPDLFRGRFPSLPLLKVTNSFTSLPPTPPKKLKWGGGCTPPQLLQPEKQRRSINKGRFNAGGQHYKNYWFKNSSLVHGRDATLCLPPKFAQQAQSPQLHKSQPVLNSVWVGGCVLLIWLCDSTRSTEIPPDWGGVSGVQPVSPGSSALDRWTPVLRDACATHSGRRVCGDG